MNGRGVISLPVKLAVSFLIIGLTLPSLMSMVDQLGTEQEEAELSASCEELVGALTRAYYAGVGNESSFQLSVPPGGTLCIGGENERDRYSVRMLIDGEEVGIRFLDRPPFGVFGKVQYLEDDCYLSVACRVVGEGAERDVMVVVAPYD